MKLLTMPRIFVYISIVLCILPICLADARTPLEMPLEGEVQESGEEGDEVKPSPDACTQKNVALQAVRRGWGN